ncbi:AraC family transcriptional regulator [Pseudomonas sp. 148P]|uniref:AraC family transcriptional regulator n=1 Tax=Pseudomonas ulcerans TaxID=3115852 RepID=A0ABU7HWT9_9PSED|nr:MULTISPECIES: AraC family transcriptional regulator [unclassified Pseudomonas]MEE1924605.1 AraC family transcriptional regulator [Pseudomonas sp. 147P]MEE1936019.1 AraC family transcriptional regulator [Pseudomonas sp. 148P]
MDSRLLSDRSSVFRHADPYAVSDYVNRHVGQHCIGLSRSTHPLASLNHRKFADLDLCRISYGGSVRVTSPALETIYHLQVLLSGNCLWRGHQREHHLVPGELLLINPDDPVDLTYSEDCEKFILKVPVKVLEAVCDEHRWQRPDSGVRFLRNHYRLDELEGFASLLAMVCQEAEASDPLLRVQSHYSQIVGSKLLSLLTTNIRRESLGTSSASFERITDYIERNLKQELSSEHLAEQARMSVRSLYALFERQLGITPKQYIRQRKLECIHACLSDPDCLVRSLTELALDYGFLHLGRFSESYRRQFGELPSDTLKRRA